jgi:nucleotide-binding universal stress UspA family protein
MSAKRPSVAGPIVVCLVEPYSRGDDALDAGSRWTLREAAAFASGNGVLHVACVLPALPCEVFSVNEVIRLLEEHQRVIARTHRWLTAGVREALTRRRAARVHVLAGSRAAELNRLALGLGADLIVVPRHWAAGHRLARAFLPSVFDRLVRLAHCPVMTAGPPVGKSRGSGFILRLPFVFRRSGRLRPEAGNGHVRPLAENP